MTAPREVTVVLTLRTAAPAEVLATATAYDLAVIAGGEDWEAEVVDVSVAGDESA